MFRKIILSLISLVCLPVLSVVADDELTGTPIGTEECRTRNGSLTFEENTRDNCFDGSLSTYFYTYESSRTWAGLDLGEPHVITAVGWAPVTSGDDELGIFEGANSPDFTDGVPLYIIPASTGTNQMHTAEVTVSRAFRYVRYIGPHGKRCRIGELKFYGHKGEGDETQFYQLTNLPVVSVHTQDNTEPADKVNEITMNVNFIYAGGTMIQEETGTIRLRGNTSMNYQKKPYRMKFESKHRVLKASDEASPAKCKKWTLINPEDDKTFMRNILGFEISRRMGMPYTPFIKAVDLIFNGEYRGTYQLCDQITIDKDRVNIPEMSPEDNAEPELTGGYLIENDALAYNEPERGRFVWGGKIPVTVKSPDSDDITDQQRSYIASAYASMADRLYSSQYRDEEVGYAKWLDQDSFLRYLLVEQFIANSDAYWSTYMYKNRDDQKIYTGPVWDLNLAFDNDHRYYPARNATDFIYRSVVSYAGDMKNFVDRVLSDPVSDKMLHDIWTQLRDDELITAEGLVHFIDSMETHLNQSQQLNYKRWNVMNSTLFANPVVWGSYEKEVQCLRDFVTNQVPWMDNRLNYGEEYVERQTDFTIENADQLMAFAQEVNTGNTMPHAVLTADIDLAGYNWKPIGQSTSCFMGEFDGQGHRILNLHIENNESHQGFFGTITGGAYIHDLIIDKSCHIEGYQYIGGLIAGSNNGGSVTIERCGNEATVIARMGSGSANAGGIVGVDMGSGVTFTIRNCYNTGNISGGGESAAFSGWLGDNCRLENCYNTGQVEGVDGTKSFCRFGGNATFTNCYQIDTTTITDNNVGLTTAEEVANGTLCYKLNNSTTNVWRQNIDNGQPADPWPLPLESHAKVLEGEEGYTNIEGMYEKEFYEIATPQELVFYSSVVAKGNQTAKGVLTADIDMTDVEFTPIGSDEMRFKGEFDGQGHIINNLIINHEGQDFVGLFGVITTGAYIHDVTIGKGSIITGNSYVAGIAGATRESGTITLERCGNEARINSSGKNAAGMIGCNRGSAASITMRDCYNAGLINAQTESAALCGWLSDKGHVENCFNCGEVYGVNGDEGLFRGSSTSINNYDLYSTQGKTITAEDLADGSLCFALDGKRNVWTQNVDNDGTIDTWPVLSKHGKIYKVGEDYTNNIPFGDVNMDGRISIIDIVIAVNMILGNEVENTLREAADMDASGEVTVGDVAKIGEKITQ